MKSKQRADEFRKMIMFTLSILILLSLTVAFGYTWVNHINGGISWAFFRRGNYLIFTLYFVLQYVLSRVYGALKIDLYRVSDIVYSQGITTLLVDAIMYAIMSLVARKMVAVAPVLILFLVQMGIILIWAYLAAIVYRKLYSSSSTVTIRRRASCGRCPRGTTGSSSARRSTSIRGMTTSRNASWPMTAPSSATSPALCATTS